MAYPAKLCLLAAIYVAVARASLILAIPPGSASPVWPPSGIALAACLLVGYRMWPAIWLGATAVNSLTSASLASATIFGMGNTLEALAGTYLVRRFILRQYTFDRGSDVFTFTGVAVLVCTIAATTGLGGLILDGRLSQEEYWSNWWTWWEGDATGIIILTPLILAWAGPKLPVESPKRGLELTVLSVLLILTTAAVFGDWLHKQALAFLVLPYIIWAAYRFTEREVTTLIAACSTRTAENTSASW